MQKQILSELKELKSILAQLIGTADQPEQEQFSKEALAKAKKGQIIQKPTDALKDHTVLEFLDLKEDEAYTESDFENAIIANITETGI